MEGSERWIILRSSTSCALIESVKLFAMIDNKIVKGRRSKNNYYRVKKNICSRGIHLEKFIRK